VKRKYESELLQIIHEEMMDMHQSGFISDSRMREFDEMCLIQEPETPKEAENPQKIERVTA
jgi:DNA-binding transcriptional regulator YiaG